MPPAAAAAATAISTARGGTSTRQCRAAAPYGAARPQPSCETQPCSARGQGLTAGRLRGLLQAAPAGAWVWRVHSKLGSCCCLVLALAGGLERRGLLCVGAVGSAVYAAGGFASRRVRPYMQLQELCAIQSSKRPQGILAQAFARQMQIHVPLSAPSALSPD
eukprot:scaffold235640_cov16-Tisochrysis_lutea.AAC.1